MKTVAAIAIFAAVLLRDLPAIIRERKWREILTFSVIAVIAFVYLMFLVYRVEAYGFLKVLQTFTKETLGLNYEIWQGRT